MKKLITIAFLCFATVSVAQNYNSAIGIKSGYPGFGSINFKSFYSPSGSYDVLLGSSFEELNRYVWVGCLFEKNMNIVNTSGWNWYIGAGPYLGYWVRGGYFNKANGKGYTGMWGGANAAIGIEYTASGIPINFALEAGPSINLMPYILPGAIANIAVRYVLN
jgi:hypothetical protein